MVCPGSIKPEKRWRKNVHKKKNRKKWINKCVPKTFAWGNSTCPSSSLISTGFGYWSDNQRFHTRSEKKTTSNQKRYRYVMWIKIPWNCYIPSIIWILFTKSWINHINNIVNGQWGFCNIGGNNNFPCSRWRWFKYFGLQKNSWNLPMIIAGHNIKEILGQKLMKSNTSISRIKYFW